MIEKYKKNSNVIRLVYVDIERYRDYSGVYKIGQIIITSSPFVLPKGLNFEDACKIISYLSEKVEAEKNLEPASRESVAEVSHLLEKYGFIKIENIYHGYSHATLKPQKRITTTDMAKELPGVVDLFTVGGQFEAFEDSDLHKRYFEWFTEGVSKKDVQTIYAKQKQFNNPDILECL